MKKAKSNIWCADKHFEMGKVYLDEQVAHLDPNDFEDVGSEEKPLTRKEAIEVGIDVEKAEAEAELVKDVEVQDSLKTEDLKPKKKTTKK